MGPLPPQPEDADGIASLLDFSSEALFVVDAQGQILQGNRTWTSGRVAHHLDDLLAAAHDGLTLSSRTLLAAGQAVNGLLIDWPVGPGAGAAQPVAELSLAPAPAGRWHARLRDVSALHQKRVVDDEQFDLAVQLAGLVIWRQDLLTGHTRFNRQGGQLLGIDARELPIERIRDHIHPDDRLALKEGIDQAIASRQPVDVVARYRQPDGDYRTLLTRRVVQRDVDDQPVGVIGVGIDVTERLAERNQALALSGRIELMVESAGVGLWSVESGSGKVQWNRRMFQIYGLAEGAAPTLKQWMQSLVHPDDRDRLRHERQQAHAAGEPVFDTEFRIVRPDGSVRWVVCSSRREATQGQPMVFGIHLDVTERRQTEEALSQARERILLATSGAGIATWDRDLVRGISYWDPQMYRLRGLSPQDPRSIQQLRSCVHPDDLPLLLSDYEVALGDPQCDTTNREFRVIWPDGSVHWLATRGTILRDDAGQAVRMLGVNWDITERKQADQARRDKEAAEQASRAKSAFLARMSHELRTPLNAVLGFAQVLQADGPYGLTPGQRQKVDHIHTAGRHLLALIDDVLDLSRIESGAIKLEQAPLAVEDVVTDALQMMGPMARKHDIVMTTQPLSGVVLADPQRLRQVLMNLLSNALKYNRPGGRVVVHAVQDKDAVGIAVQDTGRGMNERQLAGLFEPFNRLGVEREGIEGTGIGLSIAQQLTQHMGGRIDVNSRPGQGSEFVLWLPAAPLARAPSPQAAGPSEPAPHARTDRGVLRLLYIEDNEVNVLLVQELVALRAHVVLDCAVDGLSGIAQAVAQRPDVVLIDMHLPDIDGHEVLRRLRAQPATAAARCIALSANAMPEDVQRALAEGFDDYWTKPIDIRRFLSALDALAPAPEAGREVTAPVVP